MTEVGTRLLACMRQPGAVLIALSRNRRYSYTNSSGQTGGKHDQTSPLRAKEMPPDPNIPGMNR